MILDPIEIDLIQAIITGLTLFGILFFFVGLSLGRATSNASKALGMLEGFLASGGKLTESDEAELQARITKEKLDHDDE